MKLPVLEHSVRNAILDLLRYAGYLCWTNNSGAMKGSYTDKYGITKNRFTRFGGLPGASDIFAIQPGTGLFVCIEVKRPGAEKQVTVLQADFISRVNAQGGIGFVASSTEQVAQKLEIKGLL